MTNKIMIIKIEEGGDIDDVILFHVKYTPG